MFDPNNPAATPYEAALIGIDASRPRELRVDQIIDAGDVGLQGTDEFVEAMDELYATAHNDAVAEAEVYIAKVQAENNRKKES